MVVISSENEPCDCALVCRVAQRVGCVHVGRSDRDAGAEPIEDGGFAKFRRDQVQGVDGPLLSDAIDASDPLLEAARIPRQLEVDDHPAAVVQVEPFGGGIGRKQHYAGRRPEHSQHLGALLTAEAAVKEGDGPRDRALDVQQRVAILGEDHDRLARATQQPR
jgi:hypothetical protein